MEAGEPLHEKAPRDLTAQQIDHLHEKRFDSQQRSGVRRGQHEQVDFNSNQMRHASTGWSGQKPDPEENERIRASWESGNIHDMVRGFKFFEQK